MVFSCFRFDGRQPFMKTNIFTHIINRIPFCAKTCHANSLSICMQIAMFLVLVSSFKRIMSSGIWEGLYCNLPFLWQMSLNVIVLNIYGQTTLEITMRSFASIEIIKHVRTAENSVTGIITILNLNNYFIF